MPNRHPGHSRLTNPPISSDIPSSMHDHPTRKYRELAPDQFVAPTPLEPRRRDSDARKDGYFARLRLDETEEERSSLSPSNGNNAAPSDIYHPLSLLEGQKQEMGARVEHVEERPNTPDIQMIYPEKIKVLPRGTPAQSSMKSTLSIRFNVTMDPYKVPVEYWKKESRRYEQFNREEYNMPAQMRDTPTSLGRQVKKMTVFTLVQFRGHELHHRFESAHKNPEGMQCIDVLYLVFAHFDTILTDDEIEGHATDGFWEAFVKRCKAAEHPADEFNKGPKLVDLLKKNVFYEGLEYVAKKDVWRVVTCSDKNDILSKDPPDDLLFPRVIWVRTKSGKWEHKLSVEIRYDKILHDAEGKSTSFEFKRWHMARGQYETIPPADLKVLRAPLSILGSSITVTLRPEGTEKPLSKSYTGIGISCIAVHNLFSAPFEGAKIPLHTYLGEKVFFRQLKAVGNNDSEWEIELYDGTTKGLLQSPAS